MAVEFQNKNQYLPKKLELRTNKKPFMPTEEKKKC